MSGQGTTIASFIALGDSFTEGMNDLLPDGSGFRGWADRLAERLAAQDPQFRYANLSVRGKLLHQITFEQVPAALAMLAAAPRPRLVSIAGGGNDLLRPGGDPDRLAEVFNDAVARLRAESEHVLMFTGFDPRAFKLIGLLRGKIAAYNMHLRAIADHYGCELADLWAMRVLTQPAAWSEDRLHLNAESHRAIADRAAQVLGVAQPAAIIPAPPLTWVAGQDAALNREAWVAARREDYRWARVHFVPWLGRRLRGISSGDGRSAKRPGLAPFQVP